MTDVLFMVFAAGSSVANKQSDLLWCELGQWKQLMHSTDILS